MTLAFEDEARETLVSADIEHLFPDFSVCRAIEFAEHAGCGFAVVFEAYEAAKRFYGALKDNLVDGLRHDEL